MNLKVLKAIGRWVGYVLFFVLCVLVFARMVFPTAPLRDFLTMKLADATGATKVTIGSLSLTGIFPSGVSLEKVELELPGVKVKTEKDDRISPPRVLAIDELQVSASLGALMGGRIDATFEGQIQGGTLTGGHVAMPKGGAMTFQIEKFEGIALGSERLFQGLTGFDITGELSGNLDLTIPTAEKEGRDVPQFDQMNGTAHIEIAKAILHEPVVEQRETRLALSDAKLGTLKVGLKAEAGQGGTASTGAGTAGDPKGAARPGRKSDATFVSIEQLEMSGGDIEVAVAPRGGAQFQSGKSPKEATVSAHLAVKVSEAYVEREVDDVKNPGKKTKKNTAFRLFVFPELQKKGHLQDGQFGVSISGTLGALKVTTERPKGARVGGGAGASRKLNVEGGGDTGGAPADEENADDPTHAKRGTARNEQVRPGRPGGPAARTRPALDVSKLPPGALQPPPFPDFGPPPGHGKPQPPATTQPPSGGSPGGSNSPAVTPEGPGGPGAPGDGVAAPDGAPTPEGAPAEGAPTVAP